MHGLGSNGTILNIRISRDIVYDVGLKSGNIAVRRNNTGSIFWFCCEGNVKSTERKTLMGYLDKLSKLILLFILNKRNKRN
jgi:hypothetical protein